ncbi:MAG: FAD-binding protein [Oscillospiraceae bacterium]|nr:FAD-binding protein [Oscillospiraceae bacterium]
MANLKDLGKVYTSDILIIGGGIAGLCTAIKAKETNPALDVLVVDKGSIGYAGQSGKAGNGITGRLPHQNPQAMADYLVVNGGDYMNDQEFLLDYVSTNQESLEFLDHCGVKLSKNEDGSIRVFPMPNDLWGCAGIELGSCFSLRDYALKVGVRLLDRVQLFELLTDKAGAVIGAIGFDCDKMKCQIFKAKAVAVATDGCYFKKVGGMFCGYGNGIASAYRVGALMRNAEFSCSVELVHKANNEAVYGGFNLVHNKDGVNVSQVYAPNAEETTPDLHIGLWKEVQEGRGPLYCDLRVLDDMSAHIGGMGHVNDGRMMADKLRWIGIEMAKAAQTGIQLGQTPEVTSRMYIQGEFLRADREFKTNVEGLWAPGKISYQGSAYWGWVRGDGLGNGAQCGMRAGASMAKYATEKAAVEPDYEQVKALKDKIYAPLNRPTTRKPKEVFDAMEQVVFHVDNVIVKSEKSIQAILDMIEELKKVIPELTAEDAHTLAKCHDAADSLLCLEIVFRAAQMRKETRGCVYRHIRTDYPERDNKNWLKWINVKQGENGSMELFTEDIPMWRYPVRPEGYEIPEGHVEEYYV